MIRIPGISNGCIIRTVYGTFDEVTGRSREPGAQAGRPLCMNLRNHEQGIFKTVLGILLFLLERYDLFARRRDAAGITFCCENDPKEKGTNQ